MRARTAWILIVISLAAFAGVAYGSYRAKTQTDKLETRVAALEASNRLAVASAAAEKARTERLCASVDHVRERITGVVLKPGTQAPEFDLDAAPLSDAERIILTFSNWCRDAG